MRYDLGLLVLRLVFGLQMALGHGLGKLMGFSAKSATFPDPLHIGSAASLALATFGEFFCAIAVALGLFTRLTALPVITTMAVALIAVHTDSMFKEGELALLYLAAFSAIALIGGGRYSLDDVRMRRR